MEKIIPRNDPSSQAMTQDNVVKAPVYMPKPDNLAGNESGLSTTAGLGTTTGKLDTGVQYSIKDVNQANSVKSEEINITASTENRSAKWKNGEGRAPFEPGQYGNDQYQGQ